MSEATEPSALAAIGDWAEHARPQPGRGPDRRQKHRWVPITAGWLALLIGLADVVSAVIPRLQLVHRLHRITPFVPGVLTNVTFTADVLIGLLLLMLSHGLRRRKRRAWQATCLLLSFSVLIHLVHAPYLAPGVVSAILLAGLLFYRDEFYAVGDPRNRWLAVRVFLCLLIADVAIGLTYMLLVHNLAHNYSVWQRIVHTTYGLVGVSGPVQFVPEGSSDFFNILTSSLGVFTLLVTGYLFLRPAKHRARLSQQDGGEIRELLRKHGHRDSLGYFTLRNDKSVIWSATGKSCVGYRVVSGVMLASGDPIGDPEAWPGAIHAFLDEAARHAWAPAVMGCSELGAEIWCREGNLTALELGDEAIVEVAGFSLQGRQMRNVRQMASRVCRQGYEGQVRRLSEVPAEEVERLVRRADSWRGSPTERGFSMALGRVGGPGDGDCVIATATENGVLRGLLHFVPWGSDGLSLDLMRRDGPPSRASTTSSSWRRSRRPRNSASSGCRSTSRCSARRWPGASGSAPGRCCAPGAASCCSPPVGSRSSRCTSSTPSSARCGCRASSCSPGPGTRPGSRSPPWKPRRSWSGPRWRCAGSPAGWGSPASRGRSAGHPGARRPADPVPG
jgi:lysyl-tRNA synthetase class 2